MKKLSVRETFNQLTEVELIQYAADNDIPMPPTTKTGMISRIMTGSRGTKNADMLRADAAEIIANRN